MAAVEPRFHFGSRVRSGSRHGVVSEVVFNPADPATVSYRVIWIGGERDVVPTESLEPALPGCCQPNRVVVHRRAPKRKAHVVRVYSFAAVRVDWRDGTTGIVNPAHLRPAAFSTKTFATKGEPCS